eukprot:6047222-Ditylum_brightwellii.AAC.1
MLKNKLLLISEGGQPQLIPSQRTGQRKTIVQLQQLAQGSSILNFLREKDHMGMEQERWK